MVIFHSYVSLPEGMYFGDCFLRQRTRTTSTTRGYRWIQMDTSMAMTQDPIDWRYLPYIRPIFEAYGREYPQKIYENMALYGTNVPPF